MTIQSETQFLLGAIWRIITWPFTLLLFLLGKRTASNLFEPVKYFFSYIFEAKVTISLVLINILFFIYEAYLAVNSPLLLEQLIFHPNDLFSGNFISIFSSMFLHANVAHLFGNMLALFIFGRIVERKIGSFKTIILYICAGVIATLVHMVIYLYLGNSAGALGASGAIMGLVSAAVLLDPFYLTYELIFPVPVMLLGWFTIFLDFAGVFSAVDDGVAHFAHIGGYASVFLISQFLDREKFKKGMTINAITVGVFLVLALVL